VNPASETFAKTPATYPSPMHHLQSPLMPVPPAVVNAVLCTAALTLGAGCSTLRTTDPARTATEQFLLNEASRRSIEQLGAAPLRDRLVYVDDSYIVRGEYTSAELLFVIAEIRSRFLESGARMTTERSKAEVIVEARVVGVGIDRLESLFGLPSTALPQGLSGGAENIPLLTPELAIVKRLRQDGFASVAYVAYWRDSGEIVTSSGPFVGRSKREDFWILGFGPRTVGDIPPTKRD
jgi:hypothetical protein